MRQAISASASVRGEQSFICPGVQYGFQTLCGFVLCCSGCVLITSYCCPRDTGRTSRGISVASHSILHT